MASTLPHISDRNSGLPALILRVGDSHLLTHLRHGFQSLQPVDRQAVSSLFDTVSAFYIDMGDLAVKESPLKYRASGELWDSRRALKPQYPLR